MTLSLAAQKAKWLRLLIREVGLLKPNYQFTIIYIDKNIKCIETILSSNSILYPKQIPDDNKITTFS